MLRIFQNQNNGSMTTVPRQVIKLLGSVDGTLKIMHTINTVSEVSKFVWDLYYLHVGNVGVIRDKKPLSLQ